mmetsp:Transcript_42922/g.100797  ORF Transcript_42922/g.100797 Transcript_42922/m.100797 type:complete len:804 (+) Transcript_42922:71-2482(+)
MTEIDADVQEDWIRLTQATLGQCVEKPRLMAERLRKPPFRFLYDVMLEVARQTGFGAQELFAGAVEEKQAPPSTREEKIHFLEHWLLLLGTALGSSADLAPVSPMDIACGKNPEWTCYMLQCTAVAAWPTRWSLPPHPVQLPHVAPHLADGEAAPSHHHSASGFSRNKLQNAGGPGQPSSVEAQATQAEQDSHASEAKRHWPPGGTHLDAVPEGAVAAEPTPLAPEHHVTASGGSLQVSTEAEEAQYAMPDHHAAASGFTPSNARDVENQIGALKSLEEYEALQEEFVRTAEAWKSYNLRKVQEGGAAEADEDQLDDRDSQQLAEDEASSTALGKGERTAAFTLNNARMVTAKVNESLAQAQDILTSIEEGLDRADLEIMRKREAAMEKKQKELQEALDKAEAEAADEAAATEQAARRKAEKEARRAEKEKRKEEKARELAAQPKYPVSRTMAEGGARVVACVGNSDYHFDESEALQSEDIQASGTSSMPVGEGGSQPSQPAGERTSHTHLFDEMKAQLKDTFASYLAASMPESLLKQYQAPDLVACLQILLTELREELLRHSMEDIVAEAPTTLAEELQQHFPTDWLPHLQTHSPAILCDKYKHSELIDTLQSLCQVALERLEDNFGPIQVWVSPSSRLRYHSPPPSARQPSPPRQDALSSHQEENFMGSPPVAHASPSLFAGGSPATGSAPVSRLKTAQHAAANSSPFPAAAAPKPMVATTYDKSLGPPIWEQPTQQSPTIPSFNKTLGPPIWEQDAAGRRPSPSPQTRMAPSTALAPQAPSPFDRSRPATHAAPDALRFR